ncbi:MAG: hypothetical protein ACN4GZ_10575 [Acidimicrobiales bacterium]
MSEGLDLDAIIARFQERADAVKKRNLPPVGGDERKAFIQQAEQDFLDFSLIADATPSLDDGILTLTIDLRKDS